MKAAICTKYGDPEVIKIMNVDKPVPKESEILVRVYSATVGATDPVNRRGKPYITRLFSGLIRPVHQVFGDCYSGIVESVGGEVTRFTAGDQVFGFSGERLGAHAEYLTTPESDTVEQKPVNMSYDEAAPVCDGALTALPFLRDHGRIQPGDRVLINGASGSVGTYAVQLAKYFGAHVTGVCSGANAELVRSLGADDVIDYKTQDFTEMQRKYRIIFDVVANSSYGRCRKMLDDDGVYLVTFPSPGVLFGMIVRSVFRIKKGRRAVFAATGLRKTDDKRKDLAYLKDMAESGNVKTVIDTVYMLEEIREAHRHVEGGHKKGNVVISLLLTGQ